MGRYGVGVGEGVGWGVRAFTLQGQWALQQGALRAARQGTQHPRTPASTYPSPEHHLAQGAE